jgi:hypothetical protein
MNSTTNPAGHLRDRDLECARDVVAWAAIDAVQFMGTEDFGLATMEKVGLCGSSAGTWPRRTRGTTRWWPTGCVRPRRSSRR